MKSLKFIITILLFSILISSTKKHEYYVSVTKIEYVKEQQSLQIISQVFINDFEKLLRQRYDETISLDTKDESKMVNTYVERYLLAKLKIKINDNFVNFKFLGKEYKDDITYCYLEIENILEIKSIEVTNRILFDALTEQQNIVRLKVNNKNKSFLLISDNDKCILNF